MKRLTIAAIAIKKPNALWVAVVPFLGQQLTTHGVAVLQAWFDRRQIDWLAHLHQVEVNGRLDPEDLHHLIEHGAMLRRGNEIRFEFFRMPLQLCDDWSEFDGLRPGAKYHSHL